MIKRVSFDFWKTLFYSNPAFKAEKANIIRTYFGPQFTDDQVNAGFKKADVVLDTYQEMGFQPDLLQSWISVLAEIGVKDLELSVLRGFIEAYNSAVAKAPFQPRINKYAERVFTTLHNAGISTDIICNTILISDVPLDKVVSQYPFFENTIRYFSNKWYPKPNLRAFQLPYGLPNIHVGDNPVTDGACQELGIKFVHVTEEKDLLKVLDEIKFKDLFY